MVSMLGVLIATTLAGTVDVSHQTLRVTVDPGDHRAEIAASLRVVGEGVLVAELTPQAENLVIRGDDGPLPFERGGDGQVETVRLTVPGGTEVVTFDYRATFEADVAAGEIPGQIHNHSVDAHVGADGVFLSDRAAWHPRPLDAMGRPQLHMMSISIAPLNDWAFVASGDPVEAGPLDAPVSRWAMPRRADGMTLVGNRHELAGVVHETAHGPVEIVMHVPADHARVVPMYLDAARSYLDLYVPLLGAYPFRRFSIVENFFSSGFAYPGFTVLGPRVVGMAPRSLMPGFLDHELLHAWWGNGVYVSADDGNWCEGLTSYCTNYFRRSIDGGEDALRAYRRTTLMKLSADPDGLDDGPLGRFGVDDPSTPGPSRFVGYDKGAFLFMMLEAEPGIAGADEDGLWRGLRRFADDHMGRRATWDDLRRALEETYDVDLAPFWKRWVRAHTVPHTPTSPAGLDAFLANAAPGQHVEIDRFDDAAASWMVIDPDFRFYRALPIAHTVPLIGGTMGPPGVRLDAIDRPEVDALRAKLPPHSPPPGADRPPHDDTDDHLMLVGYDALARHADLVGRTDDPITGGAASFTVGSTTYDGERQAVMHTMAYPGRPGRFITVFLSNGDAGWARLALIPHYRRDTTVVWDDGQVIARRVHEPDRRMRVE